MFHGFRESLQVDAVVLVEARILGDHHGPPHRRRYPLDRHRVPAQPRPVVAPLLLGQVGEHEARFMQRAAGIALPLRPDSGQVGDVQHQQQQRQPPAPAPGAPERSEAEQRAQHS